MRSTIGTFQYLNHKEIKKRLFHELDGVKAESRNIETHGVEANVKKWYAADLANALTTFQQAKRELDGNAQRCGAQKGDGKRSRESDYPQYINLALELIPRYQKLADKLLMPKRLDIENDVKIDLPREENIGDFIAAPIGLKSNTEGTSNAGGTEQAPLRLTSTWNLGPQIDHQGTLYEAATVATIRNSSQDL
ncbi:hypothetical protein KVT40_006877 [Elsinoe batatas]|uniref:Uncharacterized protein n=1 Tax=Elsinoe batatas TaxID=2601811 RepID=A0A8K0PCZ9_9PEZI|nr:hypothetical protein KVT40_006877 [Elsinoe batatas]